MAVGQVEFAPRRFKALDDDRRRQRIPLQSCRLDGADSVVAGEPERPIR